jgi:hypothetical protein
MLLADLAFGALRLTFKNVAEVEATLLEEIDVLEEEQLNVESREGIHKLSPPWEGPFVVTEVTRPCSYRLSQMDNTLIGNSWNIEHLQKFYP